jgi:hypothetical protein
MIALLQMRLRVTAHLSRRIHFSQGAAACMSQGAILQEARLEDTQANHKALTRPISAVSEPET